MNNRNTFFNRPKQQPQQTTLMEETRDVSAVETHDVSIEKAFAAVNNEVETAPPPPVPPALRTALPQEPSLLSRIFSKVSGNATILQLFLLGAVFFMGNQFGSGCQKQKEVRQQIKMIEREHLATLKLVDSLQRASAEQEAKALKQVNDFYATLQQLDLKSEVVKTQLVKAKANVEIRQKEAIKTTIEHNETMKVRIKEGAKRSSYFDLDEDNSPTNN